MLPRGKPPGPTANPTINPTANQIANPHCEPQRVAAAGLIFYFFWLRCVRGRVETVHVVTRDTVTVMQP